MLELKIVARQGARIEGAATRFDEDGGTIGRAHTNKLVLDDPDRTVSRVHAQVVCRDGAYAIIDRGSNPLQLNGQALGNGVEAPLRAGDRLQIGGFELQVAQASATGVGATGPATRITGADDDPFAHLLDGLAPAAPAPPVRPEPPVAADPAAALFPDPLGAAPAGAADPFADLLGPAAAPAPPAAGRMAGLDDFSDFAAPGSGGRAESIDALFGLGAAGPTDPLAMSPLADPVALPNTAPTQDPLAAFSMEAPLQPPARSDHAPIGEHGFVPPAACLPAAPEPSLPPAEAGDPFAGLDMPPAATPGLPHEPAVPAALHAPPTVPPDTMPVPATPWATPAPRPASAGEAELLAALLRGLGPMQKPLEALTPDTMERMGGLLRDATEGTLQLLHTRQEFKREVRAQVTLIAAQANNPLKFSPTVEIALAHLLGPTVRGFMPAQAVMRDAWQDLRAHEFGVMVGMRAALAHVIEQFAPEALERNIAAKSRLDAIFAANRKARLWDQFVKLYADIAREAEDDFHTLFGKAFLKAYEEQMERLKAAGGKGTPDAH